MKAGEIRRPTLTRPSKGPFGPRPHKFVPLFSMDPGAIIGIILGVFVVLFLGFSLLRQKRKANSDLMDVTVLTLPEQTEASTKSPKRSNSKKSSTPRSPPSNLLEFFTPSSGEPNNFFKPSPAQPEAVLVELRNSGAGVYPNDKKSENYRPVRSKTRTQRKRGQRRSF